MFPLPAVTFVKPQLVDNAHSLRADLARQLLWLIVREKELYDEGAKVTESILAYLASRESEEYDPWVRDDLRISWITVLNAANGNPIPQIVATYAVLGIHPDKVFAAIEARREAKYGRRKKPQPVKEKAKGAIA